MNTTLAFPFEIKDLQIQTIAEKIFQDQRLTEEDGLFLLSLEDDESIRTVGKLANWVRKKKVGDVVHFAHTLYIHPTNLCELNCPLCSFYAKPGWKSAWFLSPEQIEAKVRAYESDQLTEIHVVGGLWRDCNLDYYQDTFTRIKSINPHLHIKALTPVEYDFLAKLHNISINEVFRKMMSWGLDSLPGGGAEILVEEIREKIAPGKITSEEYLSIHMDAHRMGLKSNVTMLFGHIEENHHIITHLSKVRKVQDETGGFQTFIPLKFSEENNALGKRKNRLKPKQISLIYAVSRLMLDNILHLKILWNYIGIPEALEMLEWGGNDLASTMIEEKIITMAGRGEITMNCTTMKELILSIGRIPCLTHTGNLSVC